MLEGHSPSICHISFEYNLYSCFKVHPISQCLTKAQEALLTLSLSLSFFFFYKNPVGGLKICIPGIFVVHCTCHTLCLSAQALRFQSLMHSIYTIVICIYLWMFAGCLRIYLPFNISYFYQKFLFYLKLP